MLNMRVKGPTWLLLISLSSYAPVPPSKQRLAKSKTRPLALAPTPPPLEAELPPDMKRATPVTITDTFTYFLRGYFSPRQVPKSITGMG